VLGVSGEDLIAQRIRVRLRIVQGSWALDPSNGLLGSRLLEAARMPSEQAQAEAVASIQQALEPMTDISVVSVEVWFSEDTAKTIIGSIQYQAIVDTLTGALGEIQNLTLFLPG
jgi:hypothetical protein